MRVSQHKTVDANIGFTECEACDDIPFASSCFATLLMTSASTPLAHTPFEDICAMVIGTLFVSFGLALYKSVGLLTGSTVGVAFLIHYATNAPFGLTFFLINLPFYYLGVTRMGWTFTIKTFIAVGLVSLFTEMHSHFISLNSDHPLYVAVLGGTLSGVGLLILFRHKASVGGINILALYVQGKYGLRAGHLQLGIDLAIVAASLFIVDTQATLASIVGVIAMNLTIAMNHRPGRYVGM